MVSMASWGLTPYDTTPVHLMPGVGTWSRTLNDLFYHSGARYLPVILVLFISASILVKRWLSTPANHHQRTLLLFEFGTLNLIAAVSMFAATFLIAELPLEIRPYPGYGWTYKFLAANIAILLILFCFQSGRVTRTRLFIRAGRRDASGR
jgi:hypothetical protein